MALIHAAWHAGVVAAQNGYLLKEASTALRDDMDVVLTACRQFGQALQYASDVMRASKEVVVAACAQDGWAVHFAHPDIKDDLDVALLVVASTPRALQHVDASVLVAGPTGKDLVLKALSVDGMMLSNESFPPIEGPEKWGATDWRAFALAAVGHDAVLRIWAPRKFSGAKKYFLYEFDVQLRLGAPGGVLDKGKIHRVDPKFAS